MDRITTDRITVYDRQDYTVYLQGINNSLPKYFPLTFAIYVQFSIKLCGSYATVT
jgi:hypothetical protein